MSEFMAGAVRPRFSSPGLLFLGFLLLIGLLAPAARAELGLEHFGVSTSNGGFLGGGANRPGEPSRQAGAHADFTTAIDFSGQDNDLPKDVVVTLPPGLIGNPTVVPQCPAREINSGAGHGPECTVETIVGVASLQGAPTPIYNLEPPPNLPALFAFNFSGVAIFIEPRLRPTDYAIVAGSTDSSGGLAIHHIVLKFWDVPAAPSHNLERGDMFFTEPFGVAVKPIPFFSSPTSCTGPPGNFEIDANSWSNPTPLHDETTSDAAGFPFQWEGCDRLVFDPSLRVDPGSHTTAAPSGLQVDLTVPQELDPKGLSTPHLRTAVVKLPQGVSISSAAAAGIGSCTEAQIALGTHKTPECPGSSSLGTVKLKTPLLEEDLEGEIFLAKQKENPFGSFLALYLAIKGPGFYIKLPGLAHTDPETGQVTTTFDDLPQLPFETMQLIFRGGAKAPVVMPDKCGTYTTQIELTSWASPVPRHLESSFEINQDCGTGGFDPKLQAGSTNPVAGANTPFNVQILRNDGEQNIARIETTLPKGLVASLAGLPLCEGAAAAAGSCPSGSEIGSVTAGAGNGPQPIFIPEAGRAPTHVYFGGPYKGAPYSMVFVIPAQAGPFDLGLVVVRAAVYLDPTTAQVTIKSDALPQILEGIPLDYRDIRIEVTKPSFTLNPTNCEPKRFESTITSDEGKVATPSVRFQVSDCGALKFKPKLTLSLKGGTKRSQYPALRAVLTQKPGQANIARVATTLPHSEFLANEHIRTICTRVQYAAHACPANTVYGWATAYSPILDKPISGPVYLRSSDNPLPDLVADLGGEIDIDLVGRIDSENQRIRTTFETVPDAPVSKFVLAMQGGKKSLLVNSTDICRGVHRTKVLIDGQNGKTADQNPKLRASCGKGKKQKRRR